MSYNDFFRSLTPFAYIPWNEDNGASYFKDGEHTPEALALADVNQDGRIDFPEFIFFITILQIPESMIRMMFKKKGDPEKGTMKRE